MVRARVSVRGAHQPLQHAKLVLGARAGLPLAQAAHQGRHAVIAAPLLLHSILGLAVATILPPRQDYYQQASYATAAPPQPPPLTPPQPPPHSPPPHSVIVVTTLERRRP